MMATYPDAMAARNPVTLGFQAPFEREFLEDYRAASLPFVRIELALGCALNALFSVWDFLFFPELQYRFWMLRFLMVCPYFAAVIGLTYVPYFQRYWQFGAGSCLAIANLQFLIMMAWAPVDKAHLYFYPATMYIVTYACTAVKLRFVNAGIVTVTTLVAYQLVALAFCDFPPGALANANFFLFGLAAVGMLAAYMLELYARSDFVLRRSNDALLLQVEQEKSVALQANAAKTRFLASASHDLRQPLHTIGLLVDVLRDRSRDPEQKRLAERIRFGVVAMEDLFKGLLDISRLDAGMVRANRIGTPLAPTLRSVHASFEAQAEEKGLLLRVRTSNLWVDTDPMILERILDNLVSNAIRYTSSGKVLIGCRRRGPSVEVQVLDTGAGFTPQESERIFEEFYQLHNPERDRTTGLGLGLSIVKRSAELLGHRIEVRSVPGRGSCFSIFLPVSDPTASGSPAGRPTSSPGLGCNYFIVVIDDEQSIREAMRIALEYRGCHVLCASSAEEALQELSKHLRTPDLIISDYRLRDRKNGLQAIDDVRASVGELIPAIIITGDIAANDLGMITSRGIPIAHKPLTGDDLVRLISETLPPRETAHDAAAHR
jgi:signal transduction histidine kinase/CheY-like chemotaxis protein